MSSVWSPAQLWVSVHAGNREGKRKTPSAQKSPRTVGTLGHLSLKQMKEVGGCCPQPPELLSLQPCKSSLTARGMKRGFVLRLALPLPSRCHSNPSAGRTHPTPALLNEVPATLLPQALEQSPLWLHLIILFLCLFSIIYFLPPRSKFPEDQYCLVSAIKEHSLSLT